MKTLFVITGAVCSGKTTMAKHIAKKFDLKLFSEEVFLNLENCLKNVNICKQDYAIIEHCDILENLDKLPTCNLKVFVLKLNPSMLKNNFNLRKQRGATGDYLNIDPVAQQTQILSDCKHPFDVVEITSNADYAAATLSMEKAVALRLPKQLLNPIQSKQRAQFKTAYFDFYDDIKSNTNEVYDW